MFAYLPTIKSLKVRLIFKLLPYWENIWYFVYICWRWDFKLPLHYTLDLCHANHCIYKIRYHVFFCIKYRKNFFETMVLLTIWNIYAFELLKDTVWVDVICNDGNQVYLFVGAETKYYPSRVMQIIKETRKKKKHINNWKYFFWIVPLYPEDGVNIPICFQKGVRSQVWYNCMVWSFFSLFRSVINSIYCIKIGIISLIFGRLNSYQKLNNYSRRIGLK